MCALQECSSIPLLSSRVGESKTFDVSNISPSHQAEISPSNSVDNEYRTGHRENELSFQSKMLPSDQDFVNIPSAYNEKHMKSKNFFQFPNGCKNTYSECNPPQAEIEYLLMNKNPKVPFLQEAENIIPACHKKPLSQRSISDYHLSKRNEEPKGNLTMNILSDIQPVFKPSNFSQAGLSEPTTSNCENDIFLHSNPSCYSPVTAEECYFPTSEKRNSFSVECEAGMSGLNQPDADDSRNLDEKNSYRGCNLNPTVNMKIFDTESLSESGDPGESAMALEINAQRVSDESWFIPNTRHTFSGAELSGSTSAAQLSIASSFGDSNTPTCKICHMPAKTDDPLISPCRCTGTLHYIHCGCLMRWLEICNKRSRKPPACELCKYQFHWHKKFKVRHWQFPHCSWRDKILHTVFLISVMVMIGCAIVTVMCFRQHRGNKTDLAHLELTQSEIITLICGALFFLAFFLAMYVEIKARNTIYKLLIKFIYLNQQWYIDEYDKKGENTVIDV